MADEDPEVKGQIAKFILRHLEPISALDHLSGNLRHLVGNRIFFLHIGEQCVLQAQPENQPVQHKGQVVQEILKEGFILLND
ncbi:Uncharacterised protein [Mycobacteroides abscessus subsp. abscessus]|nr:Uncharacterised protein [Mycobacteroides abscessus subsp. abscessus]